MGELGPIAEVARQQRQAVRPPLTELFASAERPLTVASRPCVSPQPDTSYHIHCHYSTVSRRLRREEDACTTHLRPYSLPLLNGQPSPPTRGRCVNARPGPGCTD